VKASGGGRSRPNNSSDEWYRHDAGDPSSGSSTPTKSASGPRPGRNDEAKRLALAAGGDPNDWYRHDHQTNGTDEAARTGKRLSPGKDGSGSAANGEAKPLWFASDGVWHGKGADNVETIGKAAAFSPKYVTRLYYAFRDCINDVISRRLTRTELQVHTKDLALNAKAKTKTKKSTFKTKVRNKVSDMYVAIYRDQGRGQHP